MVQLIVRGNIADFIAAVLPPDERIAHRAVLGYQHVLRFELGVQPPEAGFNIPVVGCQGGAELDNVHITRQAGLLSLRVDRQHHLVIVRDARAQGGVLQPPVAEYASVPFVHFCRPDAAPLADEVHVQQPFPVQLVQPVQRLEKRVLLRGEMHPSRPVRVDVFLVQRKAEKGEQVVDSGCVVVKGEFQGDFVLQAVAVRIVVTEMPEHLRQLFHRLRHRKLQAVKPCPVDEEMPVRIDVLGNQEPQLIDMPVGRGQLFPQPGLVHAARVIWKESPVDVFVQRNEEIPGNAVFLHVQ